MVRGQKIPPDMQWAIVRLFNFLNAEQIVMCLGFSTRSVRRVNSHFRAHGSIKDDDPTEERRVRRHLRDVDVEVRH